jgi:glutathione-regulated potassium-efflux system protein KefB
MRFMIIVRASRAIIPYLLERWLGLNGGTARRIGPVLSQGGEFAFVLFAMGVIQSMIGEPLVHLIKLAVTLSMAAQSLALFIDEAVSRAPRQSHLNHIAVGGLKRLAGHKELKWRCP